MDELPQKVAEQTNDWDQNDAEVVVWRMVQLEDDIEDIGSSVCVKRISTITRIAIFAYLILCRIHHKPSTRKRTLRLYPTSRSGLSKSRTCHDISFVQVLFKGDYLVSNASLRVTVTTTQENVVMPIENKSMA